MSDIRLVQLRRILSQDLPSDTAARAAVSQAAPLLADALFAEAADSDDVTGSESALAYLEERLTFFAGLVTEAAAAAIRARFHECLRAWE